MSLAVLQHTVTEMVSGGREFADVEGAIEGARVNEEEKAALWLLAWSCLDHDRDAGTPRVPPAHLA